MIQNIAELSQKLLNGTVSSRELVNECFDAISADDSMGGKAFLSQYKQQARETANWIDQGRKTGMPLPKHAGIPIAIKDLFDMAGEVTRAGSNVLDEQPTAIENAEIVNRLRSAGFIIIGKNNMTEFAYSGLGVNAHFGTPLNPYDKSSPRIPGGSSSGAGVAVSKSMVPAAIGTDTGGSCRIPAAFCGVVGFKPTSTRVPKVGAVPLSKTLDCIGPLTTSVSCAAILDSVLSGGVGNDVEDFPVDCLRIGILDGYVNEHLDEKVGVAYEQVLSRLSQRGVKLIPVSIPQLADLPYINRKGGFAGAEAYAWHQQYLETRSEFYDPWVRARLNAGKSQSASHYIELGETRRRLRALVAEKQTLFDVLILPTVQIVAPTLKELEDIEKSNAINLLCLRNTAVANFLDVPAISIPCHDAGELPVGAMLFGMTGDDRKLLSIARGLEQVIRGR